MANYELFDNFKDFKKWEAICKVMFEELETNSQSNKIVTISNKEYNIIIRKIPDCCEDKN